ncbi:MAG: flavodoxin domain-containing protein [Chloroflexi bacterium]|nr:flavodoxin domain-containing protein [Chloroflexota bacterium]
MANKVLVAYASKYGSTREVAEAVAATLRERGPGVDVQSVRDVQTLAAYSAVVLGAPLYFGAWHKDALHFLLQHREALAKLSVAVFALGPLHQGEQERQDSRAMLDKELAKSPWLRPVALDVFAGKFDPAKLHFADRLIASLPASPIHGMLATDLRDWTAIRAWASNLAAMLQPALSQ